MNAERCLYSVLLAEKPRHEEILRDVVAPMAREFRGAEECDSLFFVRYNEPEWHLRFRVLGRPDWVNGVVRRRLEDLVAPQIASKALKRHDYAVYEPEIDRYGGEEGMAIAEKIFFRDTLACLDFLEAERRGETSKSRREFSLLLTERLLDLMGFDRAARLAFYQAGHRWAIDEKSWTEAEVRILDERFLALRPGLEALLSANEAADPAAAWGGEAAAGIARSYLEAMRPLAARAAEGLRQGSIRQDRIHLVWSYAHMHCNRMGIEPNAEAILRYFVHRLLASSQGPRAAGGGPAAGTAPSP